MEYLEQRIWYNSLIKKLNFWELLDVSVGRLDNHYGGKMVKKKVKHDKQNKYFEEDSDENFYFIAGYTDGGTPYGMTWEEIIAQELSFRGAVKKMRRKLQNSYISLLMILPRS